MKEIEMFKCCPICGDKLVHTMLESDEHLKCRACDFDFFLNPAPTVSAIIVSDGKLLLAKRANDPWKNTWEIPGGFVKKGETLEQGLEREIAEELGIKLNHIKYFTSKSGPYDYRGLDYSTLISYFECGFEGNIVPNSEISEFGFFDFQNIPHIGSPAHRAAVRGYIEHIQELEKS